MRLIPLQVVAELEAAVVTDHDIHLDGILGWVQAKRILPELDLSRATTGDKIIDVRLCLARIAHPDGSWVWAASSWDLPPDARLDPNLVRGVRRKDGEDIFHRAGRFVIGGGPGRSTRIVQQAIIASSATWRCLGQPREVRKALEVISAIGSMRRHGYGRVRRWTVTELAPECFSAPADLLLVGGVLQRTVPWSWIARASLSTRAYAASRPPYWHPARQEDVARSGSRAVLVDELRFAPP